MLKKIYQPPGFSQRTFAAACGGNYENKGLVIGAYDGCNPGELRFTPAAKHYDEQESAGMLSQLLKGSHVVKLGNAQVFSNLRGDFYSVAVAGLGMEGIGVVEDESIDQCKENIRIAAASGALALQETGINKIFVEMFTNAEAAAEGATLATWRYQDLKSTTPIHPVTLLELYNSSDVEGWQRGTIKAECQNWARRLEESPGNLLTPNLFAQACIEKLCPCGIQVEVHDRVWIESKNMFALLNLASGSCEEPLVLEVNYCGANPNDKPIALIGKGVTFDTGAVCLKKCKGMPKYRGDMSGAAVICAAMRSIAQMAIPINIRAFIPLMENMMGGSTTRPGDVLVALNKKTVRLTSTGNEGRVLLIDPLFYSQVNQPCLVVTVASLTDQVNRGLGQGATAAFSTSDDVWRELNLAGLETGDRFWRLPFWNYYTRQVTEPSGVDVCNVGRANEGETCLAAAFLLQFTPPSVDFLHLDIAGTGFISDGILVPYLRKGLMSGRPTRSLVQFIYQIACPHTRAEDAC